MVLFWEVGGDVVNWATTKRGEVSWEVRSEEWRERWWWYRWWVVDVIVHMVVVMGTGNGMTEDGHVAVDPLHQERGKSSRPKIANTRLSGYDWSSK